MNTAHILDQICKKKTKYNSKIMKLKTKVIENGNATDRFFFVFVMPQKRFCINYKTNKYYIKILNIIINF